MLRVLVNPRSARISKFTPSPPFRFAIDGFQCILATTKQDAVNMMLRLKSLMDSKLLGGVTDRMQDKLGAIARWKGGGGEEAWAASRLFSCSPCKDCVFGMEALN